VSCVGSGASYIGPAVGDIVTIEAPAIPASTVAAPVGAPANVVVSAGNAAVIG
jgi:hypothetical protein